MTALGAVTRTIRPATPKTDWILMVSNFKLQTGLPSGVVRRGEWKQRLTLVYRLDVKRYM